MIHDNEILNLWTAKPCFEIIHVLLVSMLDKICKPKLSRFLQPNTSHVICKMPFFVRKAKFVRKQNEQVIYFKEQLVGDKVACSCTKLE